MLLIDTFSCAVGGVPLTYSAVLWYNQCSTYETKINKESRDLYAGSSIFDPDLKRLKNVNLNFPVGVKVGSSVALKLEWTRKGILMFEAWIKDNPEIKINVTLEGSQILDEEIDEVKKEYGVAEVGGIM